MSKMDKLVFDSYTTEMYEKHFNGRAYAEALVGHHKYAFRTTLEDFLHKSFSEGKLSGSSMLDIGCGPTVRGVITASGHVPNLYLADLVQSNRDEVLKWLNQSPDAIDCSWEFQYIASLEKNTVEVLEDRVRKATKGVLPCDFIRANPIEPSTLHFDVIVASLTLDCLTSLDDYSRAVANIASILNPNGRLAIFGIYGSPSYVVDNVQFPSSTLDEKYFRKSIADAGLHIVEHEIQELDVQYSFTEKVENTFWAIAEKRN